MLAPEKDFHHPASRPRGPEDAEERGASVETDDENGDENG